METKELILLETFCTSCGIDNSFVILLEDHELIELTKVENTYYVSIDTVKEIEQIHYFHTELHINLEGIETIKHLLAQINDLHEQLKMAQSKLARFEP
jgi:GTP1/Obg family GTP-binding protein